jgi:ATP-dependent Clp protease ATP-binding subunit ClpA
MLEVKDQVKQKKIKIKISDEAIDWLVEKGFDSKMGARPLYRVIDKEIKRPLAKRMLFGDLREGGNLIIDVVDNNILLSVKSKIKIDTDGTTSDST